MFSYLPYIISLPYTAIMTYFSFGLYKKKYIPKQNNTSLPTVSLIVSCRNEEYNISNLLDSIDLQIIKPDQVILIDDNSTDNTYSILKLYADTRKNSIAIKSPSKGKKSALIYAAQYASTDYILFTDADCQLKKEHIKLEKEYLAEYNSDMLLGGVRIKNEKTVFNIIEQTEFLSLQATTAGSIMMHTPFMCNGANLTIRKKIYQTYSSEIRTDIASGDDVFLLHSLKRDNKKIDYMYNPQYIVSTEGTGNLYKFIKQRIRWAGKTSSYTDRFTKILSTIIALTNISLIISYFFTPIIYLIKLLVDTIILLPYLIQTGERRILNYYMILFPMMSLIYPIYIIVVGILSLLHNNREKNWK